MLKVTNLEADIEIHSSDLNSAIRPRPHIRWDGARLNRLRSTSIKQTLMSFMYFTVILILPHITSVLSAKLNTLFPNLNKTEL